MPLHWAVLKGRGMLLASLVASGGEIALRSQELRRIFLRDVWQDASGRCARQLAGRLDLCMRLQLWMLEVGTAF